MLQTILHGLRAIALLFALASRAHAPARQNDEHVDFRVTDVLRPRPSRDEVLFRIAASVNPLDTKTFDGAAAHARHAPATILGPGPIQRGVSKPGFNFNLDGEENDYVARSTCN